MHSVASVISFLTVLPAPAGTLEGAARHMYLFPAVGLLVGAAAGAVGAALSLVDPIIGGLGVVMSVMVLTGLHHADGLADFADGLMAGPRKALRAMRDSSTGTAGTVATSLSVAALAGFSFSSGGGWSLLAAVAVSEMFAKMCIVAVATLGRPAAPGSGAEFVKFASKKRLTVAVVFALIPAWLAFGYGGLAAAGAAGVACLLVVAVSRKKIGGITGDVMGASNEIGRLASLATLVY